MMIMKKQEKITLLERAIANIEICGCHFSYDENYFYYYPLAVNKKFFLGQEDDDFLLNGYAIRKISQLKKVELESKYNEINKELGVTAQIQNPKMDISSWKSIFHSLKALNDIIIIEDEINNEFSIGIIKKVLKNKLYFLEFDANGIWSNYQLEIPYSAITSVQWNTRYTTAWKKYLKIKQSPIITRQFP